MAQETQKVRRIQMLGIVLVIAAAICCTIAAFWYPGAPSPIRPHLGWLGVALYFWSIVFAGVASGYHR
jgi:hypothetical protein